MLYVPQANDVIQAIDAVTGDLIWEYRRDLPEDLGKWIGPHGSNNRNITIYENLIIDTSGDSYANAYFRITAIVSTGHKNNPSLP